MAVQNITTYKLKHPVTIGSETITEVKFRRIKGKDMRSLPGDPRSYTMGTIMDLAAKVMGEASVLLDEMDSEDVVEVASIVGELLNAGQPTGATG